MSESHNILAFALVSLGMALTPGPNMIYLISRSISQGRAAGWSLLVAWRLALSSIWSVPLSA